MISPEELQGKEYSLEEKFALWLLGKVKDYKFAENELSTFSLTISVPHYEVPVVPDQFIINEWDEVTGSPEYILCSEATDVFKKLNWYDSYTMHGMPNLTVFFNTKKYTDKEKEVLTNKYPDIDITPLLNVRENLLKQFDIPEIDLEAFDKWFSDVVNKHKSNLTKREKLTHEIIFTKNEINRDYMYGGRFLKPYATYLEKEGWRPGYCSAEW